MWAEGGPRLDRACVCMRNVKGVDAHGVELPWQPALSNKILTSLSQLHVMQAERRPAHAWLPALLKNAAAAAAYGLTCACTGMSVALMLTVDMWDMFLSLFDKLIFCANFTFKTVWHSLDPVTWTQAMAGARRTGSAGATC